MTWRLEATVGDLEFTATPRAHDDPPPAPPALLTAAWFDSLVDEGAWPAIQEVSTGQLTLLFATAAEAAAIRSTTRVSLKLYRPADGTEPVATFAGRTSDPVLTPAPDGVEVTFGLADYLADLAEHTQGGEDYPEEFVHERLERIFEDSLLTPPPPPEPPPGQFLGSFFLVARPKAPATTLAIAQETIGSGLYGFNIGVQQAQLYELRPNLTPAGLLDPTTPWVQLPLPRDTPDSEATIPGSAVTLGASWSRSKFSDVNTVHIATGNNGVVRVNNRESGEPRVVYRRDTQLRDRGQAEEVARYLLPDEDFIPTWEADTFTVHLDRTADDYWPGHLRDVRTLTGIQERHNPNGTTTYKGVITATETRIERGRCTVDVTLSSRPIGPPPPPPEPPGTLWAHWPCTETSGPTLHDTSGYDRHMTVEGAPNYLGTNGVMWPDDSNSAPVYAASPDTPTIVPSLGQIHISAEVLIPEALVDPTNAVVGLASAPGSGTFDKVLYIRPDLHLVWLVYHDGADATTYVSPDPLTLGVEHKIAGQVGPHGIKLEIDDELVLSQATPTTSYNGPQRVFIHGGGNNPSDTGGPSGYRFQTGGRMRIRDVYVFIEPT